MTDEPKAFERIANFRPTLGQWAASCAACVVATAVIGFTFGGWVTGGTAESMASSAARDARAELVANICVANFMAGPDVATELAALKETSRWQRDDYIEDGGWATLAALEDEAVPGAADLCAARLADMEMPETTAEPAVAPADPTAEDDDTVDG